MVPPLCDTAHRAYRPLNLARSAIASEQDPEAKRDTIYELGLLSPNLLLPARVPAEGQLCTDFLSKAVFFFIQTVQRRIFVLSTPLLSKSFIVSCTRTAEHRSWSAQVGPVCRWRLTLIASVAAFLLASIVIRRSSLIVSAFDILDVQTKL